MEQRQVLQQLTNRSHKSTGQRKRKASTPVTDKLRVKAPKTLGSLSRVSKVTPRTKQRFTPYKHTPKTRQLRSTKSGRTRLQREEGQPAVGISHLNEILKKTWRVNMVSALHKFSSDRATLRRYAKGLSAHIQAEKQKGEGVETETADCADISIIYGIKTNEDEADAILISLKQKASSGAGVRVVATAVLSCVGARLDDLQSVDKAFTLLPLMLLRGPVSLCQHLISWLQMEFDCRVSPLRFNAIELSWMIAMWAESAPDKGTVHLQYKVPSEVKGISSISIDINASDCNKLWQSVHASRDDVFCEEEVRNFVLGVEEHFYHHFRVNLACMSLWRVGTAAVYIGGDSKLKLLCGEHVHQVLTHLTELVMERRLRPP